jgi:hypothetical protein
MVDTMIDHPEPQTFPRPDAVLAVESGQLRIPPRDGYLAQTNMRMTARCAVSICNTATTAWKQSSLTDSLLPGQVAD